MTARDVLTRLRERAPLRIRAYTAINIAGLAVGLCAALFIALMIRVENSYDRFLPDYERVFRVSTISQPAGQNTTWLDSTRPDVAEWLRTEFKSIDAIGRLNSTQNSLRRGEVEAMQQVYWADPDFLRVMPFKAVVGDVRTALDRPDSVVMTRTQALKYFGRADVLGESLEIDRRFTMQVAAVIEDLPDTTHLNIEVLASGRAAFSSLARLDASTAPNKPLSIYTYLKLRSAADAVPLRNGFPAMLANHGQSAAMPGRMQLLLMPVADIHLRSPSPGGMKPSGSAGLLAALASIGALIVLIAGINYVNLMTARGAQRAVEVGVRKSFGARRRELVMQFMGESMAYVAVASVVAVLLFLLLRPWLNGLLEAEIPAGFWRDPAMVSAYVGATLLIGALAAVYPAFVLSAFRPGAVLRGGPIDSGGSGLVRQALIAAQLAVLIGLIIGATFVHRQGHYAANEALQLNNDLVVVVQSTIGNPCNAVLRDEIRALPGVRTAACSLMAPFGNGISNVVRTRNEEALSLYQGHIDFDFFEVYGIKPIAGRLFSRSRAAADAAPAGENAAREAPLVLNQTAVRRLGFPSNEAAIGQTIVWNRLITLDGRFGPALPSEIIGVVADFPMGSIRREVAPTIYFVSPGLAQAIHVKLDDRHDIARTLDQIDELWKRLGDPRPITRRFADEPIERLYASITRQTQAFGVFSAIALFIACLGLFGLSAFATERRTREVGIRKALGASRTDIVRYFLWQFTKPVLWAAVVALPIAYVFARRWLDGFAYRVDLDMTTFAATALLTWAIACATVLAHVLRAARARPVEALRYE